MNYRQLILKSEEQLRKDPGYITAPLSFQVFATGAAWMATKLNELDTDKKVIPAPSINFNAYGLLKYSICLTAFFIAIVLLYSYSIFFTPLSILVFYFFEIHFLFLFPLLIDNVANPLYTSIQQTYKTGILKALLTVLPISAFMLIGLFSFKTPFKNWHTGSLAILIWYQYEVRNNIPIKQKL